MISVKDSLKIFRHGSIEILPENELIQKLNLGKPLRIKAGFDPTSPDLHLGHIVLISKLKKLQDLGHKIIFLIGDFTALIGDPTGKNVCRKTLSLEEIKKNVKTYQNQIFKFLDSKSTEIVFNSSWMYKKNALDIIQLFAKTTISRILERNDFWERFKKKNPIFIHELLYPIIQGYDSVKLNIDVEIGGTDQKFNLLMGREIQKNYQQTPQVIITMPLLPGINGIHKMSKSLNNYISINERSNIIFNKIMSISDEKMWKYYELLSMKKIEKIKILKNMCNLKKKNPMDVKINLAKELVMRFFSKKESEKSYLNFFYQFQKKKIPDILPMISINIEREKIFICQALKHANMIKSHSEGFRLIQQNAIKLNTKIVDNPKYILIKNKEYIVQVGKRKINKLIIL